MKAFFITKWYFIFYLLCMTIPFIIVSMTAEKNKLGNATPKEAYFLCNINSSTKNIKSSYKDVVFLYASKYGPGLELAIKSLRSTGSICRIILFIPKNIKLTRYQERIFNSLRIELEYVQDTKKRADIPHMIRYEYEYQWLLSHQTEVERIFHTDSFDVFFQGDPFSTHISKDKLTFVVEPHCIRSCGWNTNWLAKCYVEPTLWNMRHHYIICSGSIAGSASDYIKLLELMTKSDEWSRCWDRSLDQPILNVLVWMGNVTRAGIKYSFTGCDEGFFTAQWCALEKTINYNEYGQIISLKGTVPSYIHQYNRIDNLTQKLYQICRVKK